MSELVRVRNLIDITGVILKPKNRDIKLPWIEKGISNEFLDKAEEAVRKTYGQPYEAFAAELYGNGNPFLRAFFDQELHWQVLRGPDIEKLLREEANPVERVAKYLGKYVRDPQKMPKWMKFGVKTIDLEEFDVDQDKIAELAYRKDELGEKSTIVSGNSYWSRRPLIHKLGKETVGVVDPQLGIILPPYYGVKPVELKTGTPVWSSQGANRELVRAHEDDYPLALFQTIYCDEVVMPVDEHTATNQPYVNEIIVKSGLIRRIRPDRIVFAKAA